MPAEVIAIASLKRGAGTTTTACVLGAAAAAGGLRVIAVDLDPRGGLSAAIDPADAALTIDDVLRGDATMHEALLQHPSGARVVAAHGSLSERPFAAERLRALLRGLLDECDLLLLDTAAEEAALRAPLLVADWSVVPAALDIQAQRGAVLTAGLMLQLGVLGKLRGLVAVNTAAESVTARGLRDGLRRTGLALDAALPYDPIWDPRLGLPAPGLVDAGKLLLRELAVRTAPVAAMRRYIALAQGRPPQHLSAVAV